jgi:hypothetical protein
MKCKMIEQSFKYLSRIYIFKDSERSEIKMDLLNNSREPPKIRVVVRKRPLTGKELKRNDTDIVDIVNE